MLDPWLNAAALLTLALLVPAIGRPLMLLVALAWLGRTIGLVLWETICWAVAPALSRTLLRLRYVLQNNWSLLAGRRRQSLARKLIQRAGLTLDPSAPGEADRLSALSRAVHAANRLAPPAHGGALTWSQVVEVLAEVTPGLDVRAVERAEVPPPPPTGLRRVIGSFRATLSPRLPGAQHARAHLLSALLYLLDHRAPPSDDLPKDPAMKEHLLAMLLWQAAGQASLPLTPDTLPILPLHLQRSLNAASAVLYGTPALALRARLLHPSVPRLGRLAELRREHEAWTVRQLAERDRQQAARAKPMDEAEVAATLAAARRPALLLRRVDPLHPPAARSRLGGLPCLPASVPWPRHRRTGLPLHFLAQIDLQELPDLDGTSPLPRTGTLLFFADLDEDRVYNPGDGSSRVVHTDLLAPEHPLPDDLPPIDHGARPPNRPAPRAFDPWPVTAHPVDTWPIDELPDLPTSRREYTTAARDACERALSDLLPDKRPLPAAATSSPEEGFPWTPALRDALCAALRRDHDTRRDDLQRSLSYLPADNPRRAHVEAGLTALDNQDTALAALLRPPGAPLSPDDVAAWTTWLKTHPQRAHVEQLLRSTAATVVRRSILAPALRDGLPPALVEATAARLAPTLGDAQHLMLGSAQHKTNSTAGVGVRLLCLDSDYGLDFMFCDCGVIEFWMDPEDLRAGRWERAVAYTAGG